MKSAELEKILKKHDYQKSSLLAILQDVQAQANYLPRKTLDEVAQKLQVPLTQIYYLATFYRAFSLTPRGRHLISACLGTACHVRGGPAIAQEIGKQLGIKPGATTSDREFTFETVNCLGACAIGPVVVVDGHYFPKVRASQVKDILDRARVGMDKVEIETDRRIFPVEVSCARCNHSLMDPRHPIDGYPSIRVTVSFGSTHGWLTLSSLYGSYNVGSEDEIPHDTIVHMFCPHCHAELIGGATCGECSAPMVPMIVRGGGVVQICARRGCKGHILDLDGSSVG